MKVSTRCSVSAYLSAMLVSTLSGWLLTTKCIIHSSICNFHHFIFFLQNLCFRINCDQIGLFSNPDSDLNTINSLTTNLCYVIWYLRFYGKDGDQSFYRNHISIRRNGEKLWNTSELTASEAVLIKTWPLNTPSRSASMWDGTFHRREPRDGSS